LVEQGLVGQLSWGDCDLFLSCSFWFGDGSGRVTEFFKLSLSPLGEFQLLFLQVAIRLPNHLLVVLEFLGAGRGFREVSDLFLDVI